MKRNWTASSSSTRFTTNSNRVILLLDLDCFYAQCEIIRLGIEQSLPLALMQWDAALAVNYPAREFDIKRGDGYQVIQEKSKGQCIALHLPVKFYDMAVPDRVGDLDVSPSLHPLATTNIHNGPFPSENVHTTELVSTLNNLDEALLNETEEEKFTAMKEDVTDVMDTFDGDSSIDDSYKREYCLSREVQLELFEKEKNAMKEMNILRNQGKASLDRYRIASAKIFDVILKALTSHLGKDQFTLERASIDELFIDVTKRCYQYDVPAWDALDNSVTAMRETILFGDLTYELLSNDDEEKALIRGCDIAHGIRKTVFNELGFTMSAGIGQAKTFSKLAASFGKPDGQAVIFPEALNKLINQTKLRKVRNLGGKIGKTVLSLLPETEDTLGSIARFLSMDILTKHLGESTAKMVIDLSHGIDEEAVKSTVGALPKSITSFKSFPNMSELSGLEKWLNLLANDIVNRVDLDCKRNNRYPKTCTLHIHSTSDPHWNYGSSVRIPFPNNLSTGSANARIEQIKARVRGIIQSKAKFPINRIGLCATNFETRVKNGTITTFFGIAAVRNAVSPTQQAAVLPEKSLTHNNSSTIKNVDSRVTEEKQGVRSFFQSLSARKADSIPPLLLTCIDQKLPLDQSSTTNVEEKVADRDEEFARQLQASFDRENAMLTRVESRHHFTQNIRMREQHNSSKRRIDSFFSTSKKKA